MQSATKCEALFSSEASITVKLAKPNGAGEGFQITVKTGQCAVGQKTIFLAKSLGMQKDSVNVDEILNRLKTSTYVNTRS